MNRLGERAAGRLLSELVDPPLHRRWRWDGGGFRIHGMDVPIELRQLRYFVAVAEELHFGRAAKRLHMSQSRSRA